MTDPSLARPRSLRVLAATLALAAVAALTLGPRAIVAPARGAFLRATEEFAAPVRALLPNADTDQILNAVLFVPFGAAVALLLPRGWWWLAAALGAALSVGVEFAQASIPGRVPDADDVLWNTVGCAVGVVAVAVPRALAARRRVRPRRGMGG
ncbi:VanZ family protein [Microbacterium timonense]|uniref:VanZ family protein n=1 Tax=Microbacterium timonense TaxID=2086576 RepID=UPI000D1091D0|nr:VanZ family protein [Microbacterium timonense]